MYNSHVHPFWSGLLAYHKRMLLIGAYLDLLAEGTFDRFAAGETLEQLFNGGFVNAPQTNYIGSTDHSQMTTDAAGEAVYRWFPDWEKVHFYADINEANWIVEGDRRIVDRVAIFTQNKRKPRKHITGRVVSAGTTSGQGWRTEKSIDVVADKPAQITLHRAIDEKRNVTGRVVFDATAGGSLEDVEIHIVSIDDNYEGEQSLKCKGGGSFSFDTLAAEVGIFVCTEDGKAAGSIITKDLASPIQLHLRPTTAYHGQLLASGNQPVVGHPVRAYVRLQGERVAGSRFPKSFEVNRIETKTDTQGNFTLHGIPSQMRATIWADAIDGSEDAVYLGQVFLEPNESPPRTVSHLAKTAAAEVKVPWPSDIERRSPTAPWADIG